MKKIFILSLLALSALPMMADITGNGYYRVRNYGSTRWASMVDNKGSIDLVASVADLHSLKLTLNTQEILSDPGSIIYISSEGNLQYNVAAQGTSVREILNRAVYIDNDGSANGQKLYRIYGKQDKYIKYIGDNILNSTSENGNASINVSNTYAKFVKWFFEPVSATSDNYFGAVPDLNINGKLYTTLFTSFAYRPVNSDVKAFYIGRVGYGMAELKEVSGAVPAGSPVIIQCVGEQVSDNKMQLEILETALPNNALKGAYFDYQRYSVTNQIVYDPQTMRVLGKCSDGSLGFITADIATIPANTAYLQVPAGSSPEFKCVSTAEYNANIPDAPEQIYVIGSMSGWDYNDSSMILYPQGANTYSGSFNIPASGTEPISFRLYTDLGNNDSNSLGAYSTSGNNVSINLSGAVSLPYQPGSLLNWQIASWSGGEIAMTLNLQYQYLNLSKAAGIDSVVSAKSGLHLSNGVLILDNNALVEIYNISGQKIKEIYSDSFDTKTLSKGIYLLRVNGEVLKIAR